MPAASVIASGGLYSTQPGTNGKDAGYSQAGTIALPWSLKLPRNVSHEPRRLP